MYRGVAPAGMVPQGTTLVTPPHPSDGRTRGSAIQYNGRDSMSLPKVGVWDGTYRTTCVPPTVCG